MKRQLAVLALTAALFVGAVRPSLAIFDKTRFVTDLGVAYFAFHHWVWNPYKAGAFAAGAPHRTRSLMKGGMALLFAVNRIKAANDIAHKSKSPLLHRLSGSLDGMQANFLGIGQRLKAGSFEPKSLDDTNLLMGGLGSGADRAGAHIRDVPITIPGI